MRTYAPDVDTYLDQAQPGARLPIVRELPLGDRTPLSIYSSLRRRFGSALLLESGKAGRFSYVCRPSGARFVASGRTITLPDGRTIDDDPFEALRELLSGERVIANPVLSGFCGGYVGYLAYDMARHIERLPAIATTSPAIADCELVLVESFVEIDHQSDTARVVCAMRCDGSDPAATYRDAAATIDGIVDAMLERPVEPSHDAASSATAPSDGALPESNLTQAEFEAIVRRAKEYIRAGDIFQVNVSVRFAEPFDGDPLALYGTLRAINPAPYMALLELGDVAIVSASPELLVRVRDDVIETRPIAGTRPRGASPEEDERMARKLASNEKERAEHLMLVDLERNDIGRVARFGSVRVEEFMGIERYSHVIHIVSHVRGELAPGRDVIDAIRACFPGGTITGAPKVRSMEIIEELEPNRRGVYTGSIGWLGFDGSAELNIAIRTIVIVDGVAYAQAGAGIVADSEPEHEYHESVRKARAAIEALERTVRAPRSGR